jgi:nitrilase
MQRLAVIQQPPSYLNREKTVADAVAAITKTAAGGAKLIVFQEAFIPGYPAWIWRLRPGTDISVSTRLHTMLLENAVSLKRGDISPIADAAREYAVTVVCGMNERDDEYGGGTIYNTVLIVGPDGSILNRHRKLMPTNPERMVWGFGDGSGLKVVDTPCGRVGTLLCWENFMPLARYALYSQGIDIYIAPTYDNGDGWIGTLQHIAREACCWVVGSGCVLRGADLPRELPDLAAAYPDPQEWINPGDSVVIAPGGKIVAGPMRKEVGILYAELDIERVGVARRSLDVVGHYARPDIFQLRVNTQRQTPTSFQ